MGAFTGRWASSAAGGALAINLAFHPDEPDGGVGTGQQAVLAINLAASIGTSRMGACIVADGRLRRLLAGPRPVLHLDSIPQSSHESTSADSPSSRNETGNRNRRLTAQLFNRPRTVPPRTSIEV